MPETAIVILAGGQAKRMGRPKQLLLMGDETLLDRAVRVARAADPYRVCVVLGCYRKQILPLLPQEITVIENYLWSEGLASSIRAATKSLRCNKEIDGLLFMTCDQPFITSRFLSSMMETFARSNKDVVAAFYGGAPGIPALFSRAKFDALIALDGDRGARQVILTSNSELLPCEEARFDIDTPEDFKLYQARYSMRSSALAEGIGLSKHLFTLRSRLNNESEIHDQVKTQIGNRRMAITERQIAIRARQNAIRERQGAIRQQLNSIRERQAVIRQRQQMIEDVMRGESRDR